jgi:hypothetical protein
LYDASSIPTLSQFVSANPAERYYGPLEKGIYSFTLPDASNGEFRDLTTDIKVYHGSVFVNWTAPSFPLEGFDYMHLIVLTDNDGSNSTSMTVTLDTHLEFRTSSALFTLDFSTTPLESYHIAQMALARSGVFFENPVHMRVISEIMRRGTQALRPLVMKGATMAAAKAAPVAAKLGKQAIQSIANKVSQIQIGGKKKKKQKQGGQPQGKPATVVAGKKAKAKAK